MGAVRTKFGRQIRPVIDQEGHIMGVGNGHQQFGGVTDFVVRRLFQTQLQTGNVAA